jgi:2-phospho-L-lactate transferase/gluconeogenesis factor (CofD/UPF0052 family)
LAETRAKTIYVCNLVTKQGTYGFKAGDFVREIIRYSGKAPDFVICNSQRPTQEVVDKYKKEASAFVEPDLAAVRTMSHDVISGSFLVEYESGGTVVARHDSEKIARKIVSLV